MISQRLEGIIKEVPECEFLVDIGTDHGYIPICLVCRGIAKKAVAADISPQAAEKVRKNALLYNCADKMDFRAGDGLSVLSDGEFPDVITAAGMGGMLIIHVLEINKAVFENASKIILQPQRDNHKVRRFIHESGFKIDNEKMLKENGKIYNIMICSKGIDEEYTQKDYLFGRNLLKEKNILLKEYIIAEMNKMKKAFLNLVSGNEEHILKRKEEIAQKYKIYEEALQCLKK